jgi:hypothetical protein
VKLFSTRLRLILLAVVLCGAGLVSIVEFTQWETLQAVTLDGIPVENPSLKLGFHSDASVLKQPLESVAKLLLLSEQTARVDMEIDLPTSLRIRTNRFTPVGLVLDRVSGRLVGLTDDGRTVPLREDFEDWEQPIITGVAVGKIFERCDDPRVELIVPQLVQLYDENRLLYRLIDEIDLSLLDYVTVTVSGLPYHLKATADDLFHQVTGFFEFMELYQTPIDTSSLVDLRFSDLIIQERPGDSTESKSKKIDTTDIGGF